MDMKKLKKIVCSDLFIGIATIIACVLVEGVIISEFVAMFFNCTISVLTGSAIFVGIFVSYILFVILTDR